MSGFQVDLTNCDREPIHIPGAIQSHGFMFALDDEAFIRFVSDNISGFIPELEKDILGAPLASIEHFFDNIPNQTLLSNLLQLGRLSGYEQINPYQVSLRGEKYNLVISKSGPFEVLEFEPEGLNSGMNIQRMIGKSVSEMLADRNLQNLLNNTAIQVQNIISYDRVMIYRFADDGHGEVIAEAKNEELESWLGLHYPASDIPKQARELYKLNLTRLIADVDTVPSRISAEAGQNEPLDLTWSQLRAVSPIHIQYLKNMGVSSSFSISLIYKQELWGLVACHNYTPKFIDFKSRESAKLIGQILSSALEFRQDEENQLIQEQFKDRLELIIKVLQSAESPAEALRENKADFLRLTHATGAAFIYEKEIIAVGDTPGAEQIRDLADWAKANLTEPLFVSSNLAAIYPPAAAYKQVASGVMIIELTRELNEYIMWFKPEHIQTVNWAGNPDKPVEINEQGMQHISPRNSFAVWRQDVKGCSDSWKTEEVYSANRLKEEILYALNLKAGALRLLNEKLKVAYEELDAFSYTISHDLKNPLAAIKSYSQLISRSPGLAPREANMVSKITEQADKMNFMIAEVLDYSRVGRQAVDSQDIKVSPILTDIINEMGVIYGTADLKITVGALPDLYGDPVMVSQVFSNLVSNAVKYSREAPKPEVSIRGRESDTEVIYEVSDNGSGIAAKDIPGIFELFNRLQQTSHIEGSGVGLAIVKRIVDKHRGRIWVESEEGKGSTFFLAFKKHGQARR